MVLHFHYGGYFFVLSINILSRNNAAAYVEQHDLLHLAITLAGFFSCALFDELEQEINQIIFFLA